VAIPTPSLTGKEKKRRRKGKRGEGGKENARKEKEAEGGKVSKGEKRKREGDKSAWKKGGRGR